MKRIFSMLMAIPMLICAVGFVTINVQADEVVTISNLAELEAFREDVNSGNTYEGKTVKLTADIDMSEKYGEDKESWTLIDSFEGIFDGNNHTISGLYAYTEEEYGQASFFDSIYGIVSNLNIKGTVIANTKDDAGAAGIAIWLDENAQMLNCSFEGIVKNLDYAAGGLIEINSGLISNCRFKGKVEGMHLVGGIVGTDDGTITNCINEGEIIGTSPVGGIAGAISYGGKATNCVNKGIVKGRTYMFPENEPFTSFAVGGIVGMLGDTSSVENCYNIGAVSGNTYTAGIVGDIFGSSNIASIKNCYNSGNITSTLEDDEEHFIGGILGTVLDRYQFHEPIIAEAVNCYYLTGTADKGIAEIGESGTDTTTALTSEQFADKSNFTNWDFDTVWEMDANFGRPVLRSNKESVDEIIEISTVEEFKAFADSVDNGNTYDGKTVTLTEDIDLSSICGADINGEEVSWTPIGENGPFNGTFDGNGHTVSGLYIHFGQSDGAGLFGWCEENSQIMNLVVDGSVTVGYPDLGGAAAPSIISGIVGFSLGKIANCHNKAAITGIGNGVYAAGICGMGMAAENCINTGVIVSDYKSEAIIAFGSNSYNDNCYYLEGTSVDGSGAEAKTAEQFASGEVAYLLGDPWGQKIGVDEYPVIGGDKVYFVNGEYTNTPQEEGYCYTINSIKFVSESGEEYDTPPTDKSFIADVDITEIRERDSEDHFIIAVYDIDGALISMNYIKANLPESTNFSCGVNIPATNKTIGSIKAFVWDSIDGMIPLAESKEYTKNNK